MNEPLWRRRNPAVAPSYMAAAGSDVGYSARRRVPAYPSIAPSGSAEPRE